MSVMVPSAEPLVLETVAPVAPDKVTVNDSLASMFVSPMIGTVKVLEVSPVAKFIVCEVVV